MANLLAKIRWSQQNEAIRWFVPHGGQEEFIRLLDDQALLCLSGAGNGWGKSEVLAAILAAAIWPGLAPAGLAVPLFQNWTYPKRARVYSTPAELEAIGSLQTAIKRLFPSGRYSSSNGKYGYPSVFVSDTGWILDMFSYERDAAEAAGPNIGLQIYNEPPPEPIHKEAVARSRAGGIILAGMTSLYDEPWTVDGLLNRHDGKTIKVRYGNSCENCIEHGKNGHLRHERIMQILAQYDEDEREARFSGKPLSLSGRILKGFDRSVHVAPEEFEPPQGATIGMACDPAIAKPLFMLWRFVDAQGVLNYFDEWPNFDFEGAKDSNLTVTDYVGIIRQKEQGRPIASRILDRHFGNARRTLGGQSLREEFSNAGVEFEDSYSMDEEVETGIHKIKEMLRWDKAQEISNLNYPRIRISPRCRNLIAAIERWGRNPETGKPLEEYKDPIDVLRYDVMSNPIVEVASDWTPGTGPSWGVRV